MIKRLLSAAAAIAVIMSAMQCGAEYVEGGDTSGCPPPDVSMIQKGTDIDSFTTTAVNPWMKQYHLTFAEQVEAGYLGGECGQKCFALAAAPTNPNIVLLGTDTESVWRSEDGGLSWIPSDEGLQVMGTHYITFSPDDENIAFVTSLTNESGAKQKEESGLYKSKDSGKTWYKVLGAQYAPRVFSNCMLAFSDKQKDGKRNLYTCGNTGGVYKSVDDGETWINIGLEDKYIDSIDCIGNAVVACTQKNGLMVTYDDGATWTEKNNGIEEENVRAFDSDPKDDNHWFVVTPKYLYESSNSGNNWKKVSDPVQLGYTEKQTLFRLKFSPVRKDGSVRLYITCSSVQNPMHYSDDYGKTAMKPIVDNNLAIIRDNWGWSCEPYYVLESDPDIMWISLDGQIMKSTDGGESFFASSSGYSGMRACNFYFNIGGDVNDFYITTIDRSAIRSVYTDNGEKYPLIYYMPNEDRFPNVRTVGSKTAHSLAIDPKNPERILVNLGTWGGTGNNIKESLDGGLNWHNIPNSEGITTKFMSFNKDNPDTVYAGNKISYDNGVTWVDSQYKVAGISPINGNVIYAVAGDCVYKSDNEGRNWSTMCSSIPTSSQRVSVDKFKPDKLYIGTTSSGVCIVDGSSFSMKNAKNGITPVYGRSCIYSVAQDPENEQHLVAGGTYATFNYKTLGIFESYDGGETWKNIPGILNAADVWIIEFRPGTNQVWIGTSGGTYVYEFDKYFDAADTLYTDIDESYAKSEIISLYNGGIYDSMTDGKFEPKGFTSRNEFSKLMSRALGVQSIGRENKYADVVCDNVSLGGYWYPYVQGLSDIGIYAVPDSRLFGGSDNLTYGQLAVVGARALAMLHINDEFTFAQLGQNSDIPTWCRYAYRKCTQTGLINPSTDFDAGAPATNEDIAHFIYKIIQFKK